MSGGGVHFGSKNKYVAKFVVLFVSYSICIMVNVKQVSEKTSVKSNKRDVQRRIFLSAMRTVYPNSILVNYRPPSSAKPHVSFQLDTLHTGSKRVKSCAQALLKIRGKNRCSRIGTEQFTKTLDTLDVLFQAHLSNRRRNCVAEWVMMVVMMAAYVGVGVWTRLYQNVLFDVVGVVVTLLSITIVPNLVYTHRSLNPLILQFNDWKKQLTKEWLNCGVDIVKITSGELVSPIRSNNIIEHVKWMVGSLMLGSGVWMQLPDVEVEIFWRSVKSGQNVRRYSLMIASESESEAVKDSEHNSTQLNSDGGTGAGEENNNSTKIRLTAVLKEEEVVADDSDRANVVDENKGNAVDSV